MKVKIDISDEDGKEEICYDFTTDAPISAAKPIDDAVTALLKKHPAR